MTLRVYPLALIKITGLCILQDAGAAIISILLLPYIALRRHIKYIKKGQRRYTNNTSIVHSMFVPHA